MNNTNTAAVANHVNLSAQYGVRAYMTIATFVACGIVHVARRFFRADLPGSGKIELYTVAPGADPTLTINEDWLGYAVPGTRVARLAAAALDAVGSITDADQTARAAALEMV